MDPSLFSARILATAAFVLVGLPAVVQVQAAPTASNENPRLGERATMATPPPVNLAMGRYWEVNPTSMANLETKKNCRMYYTAPAAVEPLGQRPPAGTPFALVNMNQTKLPFIQPINSQYISKVECNLSARWVRMWFNADSNLNYAWDSWTRGRQANGDYVVVTDVPSCLGWGANDEKTFLRATAEQRNNADRTITCTIVPVTLSEAVGDGNIVDVDFENIGKGNAADSSLEVFANGATPDPTIVQNSPAFLDASGDSDFDEMLDRKIGFLDVSVIDSRMQRDYNMSLADFYGPSDLPDLAGNLARRSLRAKIKAALKKVVEKVKTAVVRVANAIVTVATAVVNVIKSVVDVLSDFANGRGLNLDIKFDSTQVGKTVTTPFNNAPGYQLFSATSQGERLRVDVFCVDCGIKGDFKVNGKLSFAIAKFQFDSASLTITGNILAALQIGLVSTFTASGSVSRSQFATEFDKRIITLPLTPFAIPNIIAVGPFASLDAGADLSVEAVGKLLAGGKLSFPNIVAVLDAIDPSKSKFTGFKPVITPVFEVEGTITTTLSPFLAFSLGVGIDMLNGKFSKSVAIVDKPRAIVSAGVGGSFSLEGTSSTICQGVDFRVAFGNDLLMDVFGKEFIISSVEADAFRRCFALGRRGIETVETFQGTFPPVSSAGSEVPALEQRQSNGGIGDLAFEGGFLTQISSLDGNQTFRMRHSPNGNLYAVPDSKIPANETDKDWTSWFATDDSGAFIFGDTSGRFLHGYKDSIQSMGISRLRLHHPNALPKTTELLMFTGIRDPALGSTAQSDPYLMLADLQGGVYFPVLCVYSDDKVYPKMFMANRTNSLGRLLSNPPDVLQRLTGRNVKSCGYIPLTNGAKGNDISAAA